ncbi:DUF1559 domain-containing protein [Maioricimonas sp. JC845]|uniref:DUF1559 domain-containing protein n=1 Tax=Maioricimonas sp. JC845 TaxID=3232138 RepID=UPI0034599872
MRRTEPRRERSGCDRRGLSMIELIVVMGLIAMLAALTLPAVGKARQAARRTQCINNLRNIAFGLTQFDQSHNRLPASGNYWHNEKLNSRRHVSWAVTLLPYIGEQTLFDHLDLSLPLDDPANEALTEAYVPIYVCPVDLSRSKERTRDLSYVVNAGVGFTTRLRNGVRDCPIDTRWTPLDLDGDGSACSGDPADDEDRKRFKMMGLFFLETWNTDITKRHHSIADIKDGTSQTFMVTENVRAGFDPNDASVGFADPTPYRSSFFIGNPCLSSTCSDGNVDYQRCNAGDFRINSGVTKAEGSSPVPNSFHEGGVYMAYADGHVTFLSESIDGAVYAAMASPQGLMLADSPLEQVIVSGEEL